jgi:hypothetical protein
MARPHGCCLRHTLIAFIAEALDAFTADECKNYLANSGYRHQS